MIRPIAGLLLVSCGLLYPSVAAADFTIDLKVETASGSKTVHADAAALGVKPRQREVLHVKAGTKLTVQWTLTNADAKQAIKNVVVHFVAVKEEELGQRNVPKLNKGVAAESALTMDFGPRDSTRGRLDFTIDVPGAYLLRLETIGAAAGVEGQEFFAALDVAVEPKE
jgi:hypothetical protein